MIVFVRCLNKDFTEPFYLTLRPSKGVFDVALSLVCQSTCRWFGKGQMSLLLFRNNKNVAVVLNLCDAISNFSN